MSCTMFCEVTSLGQPLGHILQPLGAADMFFLLEKLVEAKKESHEMCCICLDSLKKEDLGSRRCPVGTSSMRNASTKCDASELWADARLCREIPCRLGTHLLALGFWGQPEYCDDGFDSWPSGSRRCESVIADHFLPSMCITCSHPEGRPRHPRTHWCERNGPPDYDAKICTKAFMRCCLGPIDAYT